MLYQIRGETHPGSLSFIHKNSYLHKFNTPKNSPSFAALALPFRDFLLTFSLAVRRMARSEAPIKSQKSTRAYYW